jgi:hypothetical protein
LEKGITGNAGIMKNIFTLACYTFGFWPAFQMTTSLAAAPADIDRQFDAIANDLSLMADALKKLQREDHLVKEYINLSR